MELFILIVFWLVQAVEFALYVVVASALAAAGLAKNLFDFFVVDTLKIYGGKA